MVYPFNQTRFLFFNRVQIVLLTFIIIFGTFSIFSGHNSHRRFRSHTPFSTKTSYSGNTYLNFLEDDEEVTGIVEDYLRCGRPGWSQNKEHLEHGVVSSDHMPDIGTTG